jgi:hypothetical protein
MKPRGEVVSSGLIWWMVHTGIHFPHLMQSSLVSVKLKISSGFFKLFPYLYFSLFLFFFVFATKEKMNPKEKNARDCRPSLFPFDYYRSTSS